MPENFYRYVRQRMGILLAWGTLNLLAGGILSLFTRDKFWRQFWLQCLAWGGVNSLLAGFTRHSYKAKLTRLAVDKPPPDSESLNKEVRFIYLIIFVNVFLDAGYVVTGEWLRRKGQAAGKPGRSGMGLGIIVQGLYIFLFDVFLTQELQRRWRKVNN